MRTWGDIKNEVLGLIFSNNTGGNKVSLSDSSVKEYIINMPEAFNSGISDIIRNAMPIVKSTLVSASDAGQIIYDMSNVPSFDDIYRQQIYFTINGDTIPNNVDFFRKGRKEIILNAPCSGTFEIYYKFLPERLTDTVSDSFTPDIDDCIIDAVVYYMASRLYGEDDIQLATYYMNIYSDRKTELANREMSYASNVKEFFTSERGWV